MVKFVYKDFTSKQFRLKRVPDSSELLTKPSPDFLKKERRKWLKAWSWLILAESVSVFVTTIKPYAKSGVFIFHKRVPWFVLFGFLSVFVLVVALVVFLVAFSRSKGKETRQLFLLVSFPILSLSSFIVLFADLYKWSGIKYTGTDSLRVNLWHCLYFATITMTTVGYGDFIPLNQFGRFLAAFEALSGYLILGALITALSYIGRSEY